MVEGLKNNCPAVSMLSRVLLMIRVVSEIRLIELLWVIDVALDGKLATPSLLFSVEQVVSKVQARARLGFIRVIFI